MQNFVSDTLTKHKLKNCDTNPHFYNGKRIFALVQVVSKSV